MEKHDYQVGAFDQQIRDKATQYLTMVVSGTYETAEVNLVYKQLYEIAQLARTVLTAEDDKAVEED